MDDKFTKVISLHDRAEKTSNPVPELILQAGNAAKFVYDEFFCGRIRNQYTRKAYLHVFRLFSAWCVQKGLELIRVAPGDVGRYLDAMQLVAPTRKLHLSALRRFFDELVVRHVIILNPALSVRGDRIQVIEGKTPEISIDHARQLLQSIDLSHVVGVRDHAIIGILVDTAARVGAVAKLRRSDLYEAGGQFCLLFNEKGGKVREIPLRHDLLISLNEYLRSVGLISIDSVAPLFRTANRRTKRFTTNPMSADDISRMIKRRLRDAGLSTRLSPHSFRVMTITDLLEQGVPLGDVQYLAGHADPRTTRLYDRRMRRITRNIVERISV